MVLRKRFGEFSSRADLEMAIGEFLGQMVDWKGKLSTDNLSASADSAVGSELGESFLQV